MSSSAQCEAISGCPLSYLLAPFSPRIDYLLTGNQHGMREPVGTASTESEGPGDQGAVWLDQWASPGASTQHHELSPARQGMCSGEGACCCQSFLPNGGSSGGRAGCVFLSWNWSIYSLLMLLQ